MAKELSAIVVSLLFCFSFGATVVSCGDDGASGAAGADGSSGTDGQTGQDGQDAGNLLIINLEGVDELGTANDTAVVADFAGDVSGLETELTGGTLTLSYSRRSAPEVIVGVPGQPSDPMDACGGNHCVRFEEGQRRILLAAFGDVPGTGFLEPGSAFRIAFDKFMVQNEFVGGWPRTAHTFTLAEWINGQVGIDNAFEVAAVAPNAFIFVLNPSFSQGLPIMALDAQGNNVGLTLVMPPYLIKDVNGDGNAMAVLTLHDGATLADQAEPAGVPFDATIHHVAGQPEDGIIADGESFVLEFTQEMDPESTRAAIKRRLEEDSSGIWTNVEVTGSGTAFTVIVHETDANLGSDMEFELVLQPWDVTNLAGISNTTDPISFVITDITVPELVPQVPDHSSYQQIPYDRTPTAATPDTLAIELTTVDAGGADTPVRTDNDELVQFDTLIFGFTETMDTGVNAMGEMADALNTVVNGSSLVTGSDIVDLGGGSFSFQLRNGDTADIAGLQLRLGVLDPNRIKDTSGNPANDISVNLAPNQNPTATKADWLVPARLIDDFAADGGTSNGLHLRLFNSTDREDATLQVGDVLEVVFTKQMDYSTTTADLARLFATASISGGSRGGTWNEGTVAGSIVYTVEATTDRSIFTYTLQGDQTLSVSSASFSLGAIDATTVLDIWGLHPAVGQQLNTTRQVFDPIVPPTLDAVVGTYNAVEHCGNGLAEEADTISFQFSEPIHADNQDDVEAEIVALINAQITATGNGGVDTADVSANPALDVFTVTIPQNTYFDVSSPITFQITPSDVVDVNGVVATTATATMEPFDVLLMDVVIGRNLVPEDGTLTAGDTLEILFSCQMDNFTTLSAVQEGIDSLMGNGTAWVETADNYLYTAEILPGQMFDANATRTLTVGDVATDLDISDPWQPGTTPPDLLDTVEDISGPFTGTFADLAIEDLVMTYVPGSATGDQATFAAGAAIRSGTWYLSTVSAGITRIDADFPVVFTELDDLTSNP